MNLRPSFTPYTHTNKTQEKVKVKILKPVGEKRKKYS